MEYTPTAWTRARFEEVMRRLFPPSNAPQPPWYLHHIKMLDSTLRLATNLYQETFHFVLEMIQNADDNTYPPNVEPTLTFHLHGNGVLEISNNESGFTGKDLESICSLGLSSKKKDRSTIGEKGLGFKSIFKVGPRPEIHSNGLHIQFDIERRPFGVIQPTWLDDEEDQTGTCIVVQVEDDQLQKKLQQHLMNLSSDLLLFLNKLQVIQVVTPGGKKTLRAARNHWIKEQSKAVELAFPAWCSTIEAWDEAISSIQRRSKLHVFLPTELLLGAPYFINGRFEVVPSRDTITNTPQNNLLLKDAQRLLVNYVHAQLGHVKSFISQNNDQKADLRLLCLYDLVLSPARWRYPWPMSTIMAGLQHKWAQLELICSIDGQLRRPQDAASYCQSCELDNLIQHDIAQGTSHPMLSALARWPAGRWKTESAYQQLGLDPFDLSTLEGLLNGEHGHWLHQHYDDDEWFLLLFRLLRSSRRKLHLSWIPLESEPWFLTNSSSGTSTVFLAADIVSYTGLSWAMKSSLVDKLDADLRTWLLRQDGLCDEMDSQRYAEELAAYLRENGPDLDVAKHAEIGAFILGVCVEAQLTEAPDDLKFPLVSASGRALEWDRTIAPARFRQDIKPAMDPDDPHRRQWEAQLLPQHYYTAIADLRALDALFPYVPPVPSLPKWAKNQIPFSPVTEEFKSRLTLLLNWLLYTGSTLDTREMAVPTTQGLLPAGLAVWPQRQPHARTRGPSGLPELLHEFSDLRPERRITLEPDIAAYLTEAKSLVSPQEAVGLADIVFSNYAPLFMQVFIAEVPCRNKHGQIVWLSRDKVKCFDPTTLPEGLPTDWGYVHEVYSPNAIQFLANHLGPNAQRSCAAMLDILAAWRRQRMLAPSRTAIYPLLAQVPQAELQSVWQRLQTEPWLWTGGGWKRPDEVAFHPQGLEKAYQSVVLRKYSLSNHPTIYHQPGVQELLRNVNVTEGLQEEDHLALLQQMGTMPRTVTVDDKARAATIAYAALHGVATEKLSSLRGLLTTGGQLVAAKDCFFPDFDAASPLKLRRRVPRVALSPDAPNEASEFLEDLGVNHLEDVITSNPPSCEPCQSTDQASLEAAFPTRIRRAAHLFLNYVAVDATGAAAPNLLETGWCQASKISQSFSSDHPAVEVEDQPLDEWWDLETNTFYFQSHGRQDLDERLPDHIASQLELSPNLHPELRLFVLTCRFKCRSDRDVDDKLRQMYGVELLPEDRAAEQSPDPEAELNTTMQRLQLGSPQRAAPTLVGAALAPVHSPLPGGRGTPDHLAAIGRSGEEWAMQNVSQWAGTAHVQWENRAGESYRPYDFTLRNRAGGIVTHRVDVKTTTTSESSFFMSANEIREALECANTGVRYLLLIISNFGARAQQQFTLLDFCSAVNKLRPEHIKFKVGHIPLNPVRVENGALVLPFL